MHVGHIVKDLTGQKFGKWTVVKFCETRKYRKGYVDYWICECTCGKKSKMCPSEMPRRKSCRNCYAIRQAKERKGKGNPAFRHGLSKKYSRLMNNYSKMHNRCENSYAHNYCAYGGRGIKVCPRWSGDDGFLNFFRDMGERPSPHHSLDRIDVNGDYEPSNCRWADAKTQANNKRPRRRF